jgi:hypothetical protein
MQALIVDIRITADEYQKYYRVPGTVVTTRSRDGRRVQFPANILQGFISHSGIEGSFRIQFSNDGKFQSIEALN